MKDQFGQLTAPNFSAKANLADFAGYFFGLFLLSLPFLPFLKLDFILSESTKQAILAYFALFTFFFYLTIMVTLASLDLARVVQSWWQKVKSIQLLKPELAKI